MATEQDAETHLTPPEHEQQFDEASSTAPSNEKATALDQKHQLDNDLRKHRRRRNILIAAAVLVVVLAIVIPVAVVYGTKSSSDSNGSKSDAASSNSSPDSDTNPTSHAHHATVSDSDVPKWARGGYLDPSTW